MKHVSIICTVFFIFCLSAQAQRSNEMKWLVGSWRITKANGTLLEKWKIENDSTLTGVSYYVTGADTIPQEDIVLIWSNGHWYFNPTTSNQNEEKPVSFKIIFFRGTEFVAENPKHDFPQKIYYRLKGKELLASIEGMVDGKFEKRNFDFQPE